MFSMMYVLIQEYHEKVSCFPDIYAIGKCHDMPGNYQAEYYDQSNNLGRTVVYDRNGTIIREDHELGAGDFPTAIGDYYTQNFPNESYRVWSSEDVSGNRVYYGKCKDQVAWFDKEGKYMQNKPVKTGPSKKERNRPAGKAGKK